MADRLEGKKQSPPEALDSSSVDSSFEQLRQVVEECCPTELQQRAALVRPFLPLCQRMESLVHSLDQEI